MGGSSMKSFASVLGLVALSSSAPQFFRGASLPLAVRGAGQTSSQSVSRPGQEVRSLVQSKAFGATHATTSQFDNSKGLQEIQPALGALRPVNVGLAAVRSPVVANTAPLGYAARPLVAHANPAYAAAAYAAPLAEVSPYNFNYTVAKDYSSSNCQAGDT